MDDVKEFGAYQAVIGQHVESDRLIISLSGFGPETGEIPFESVHSFSGLESSPNLIYVKDNTRSWYTNRNGMKELVEYILDFVKANKIEDVTTFGISMGGFGAVLLARKIGANRAIALSPRTLVGPRCTFDNRNINYTRALKDIECDDIRELLGGGLALTVIFSIDDPFDATHASRLVGTGARVIASRGEHNIARTLKNRGELDSFLEACISDNIDMERYGFFDPPPESLILGMNKIVQNSDAVTKTLLNSIPDEFVPEYLYGELVDKWSKLHFTQSTSKYFSYDLATACPAHPFLVAEGPHVAKYLGVGWAGPEEFGVWADGAIHTIKLRMTSMPASGSLMLTLVLRPFRAEEAPQISANYLCNGAPPVHLSSGEGSHTVSFVVSDPCIEITVHTPNAVRPADLGVSNDSRFLSVALLSIKASPVRA
jgi:pimeloyl-ACP methyl ester carboxylesterase